MLLDEGQSTSGQIPVALTGPLIAILAASIWSFSMVVAKRGLAGGGTTLQVSVLVAAVDTVVYWGVLFVLYGTELTAALTPRAVGIFIVAGIVGTALGRLSSFTGIHRVGASINAAGISTRPLFAAGLALVLLGEPLGLQVGVGIVILVVGLVILSISKGGDIRGWRPRDLLFPLGAAGAFAAADIIRRFGFTTTPATALHGVTLNETAGVVVLAAYVATRRRDAFKAVTRRTYAIFVAAGVFNAISLLLFFIALEIGPVAVASSLIGTTPLFTTIFAFVLLGDLERITPGVVGGATLVVAGAVLITLA